jgi:hypothetical protein
VKRALVHNYCADLTSDHRPTWWAEERESCPDCDPTPSGGAFVALAALALPYVLLLAALVAWSHTSTCSAAAPPADAGGTVGTQQNSEPALLGRPRHGRL